MFSVQKTTLILPVASAMIKFASFPSLPLLLVNFLTLEMLITRPSRFRCCLPVSSSSIFQKSFTSSVGSFFSVIKSPTTIWAILMSSIKLTSAFSFLYSSIFFRKSSYEILSLIFSYSSFISWLISLILFPHQYLSWVILLNHLFYTIYWLVLHNIYILLLS